MKRILAKKRIRVADNLYRDGRGRYFARRKDRKKTLWHDLQTDNPDRAKSLRNAWLLESRTLDTGSSDLTLGSLIDLWLATKNGTRERTLYKLTNRADMIRKTFPGGTRQPVSEIRARHLVEWINHTGQNRRWMRATFNSYRGIVRDVFKVAVANRIISKSPFDPEQIPRRGKRSDKGAAIGGQAAMEELRKHIPTYAEFRAIVANVRAQNGGRHCGNGGQSADFLEFLGEASVGQAEAADVKWENVKPAHIEFTRRKTGVRFDMPRWKYEDEGCLDELVNRLRAQPPYDSSGAGHIFTIADPHIALENACKRLHLRHFTPRDLRSMGIVRMIQKGFTFAEVAEMQGHQDGGWLISTTYAFAQSGDRQTRRSKFLERARRAERADSNS